jgi:hypothetical protein
VVLILPSSLLLLIAGINVVACVTAVACTQAVAGIVAVSGVLLVTDGFLLLVSLLLLAFLVLLAFLLFLSNILLLVVLLVLAFLLLMLFLLLLVSLLILASLFYLMALQWTVHCVQCTMRHIRLSDYGYRTIIFYCYWTIGISNIGVANSRKYLTIKYRVKASIYSTFGNGIQKKLSLAHLCLKR